MLTASIVSSKLSGMKGRWDCIEVCAREEGASVVFGHTLRLSVQNETHLQAIAFVRSL